MNLQMKQNLIVFYISCGILILVGVIFWFSRPSFSYSDEVVVLKTWELPDVLREISGISHIDDNTIACIQDEDGIIFIYDLEQEKIVKEIEFGSRGDYESIRIVGTTAFVMKSNGDLHKISDFNSDKISTRIFKTDFTDFNDIESFDFNYDSGDIITVPKENNLLENRDAFIIYKLNPTNYKVEKDTYSSISYTDSFFDLKTSMFVEEGFFASELTIHPETKDIYVLDSRIPKLMVLNPDGSPKKMHLLNPDDFQQPEGLSFDSEGKMYISNEEGNFRKQNIQLVELK